MQTEISVDAMHEVPVVRVVGECDLSSRDGLAAALEPFAKTERSIVVDFAECQYFDSTTLGVLVAHANEIAPHGKVVVVAPRSHSQRILRIAHLDEFFVVVGSRGEADAFLATA